MTNMMTNLADMADIPYIFFFLMLTAYLIIKTLKKTLSTMSSQLDDIQTQLKELQEESKSRK